jgi:uncharacterized protein (DUF1697 family)
MPRYVAFLRGVSPTNARMPELERCFELAGFTNVKTVLASGNVVFDATQRSEATIERKAEQAMASQLARTYVPGDRGPVFMTLIEDAFGKDVTTRTWETVRKCAAA